MGFALVASGLLLEEGGYPLGIWRLQKNLGYVLGLGVPGGPHSLNCFAQVIVASLMGDAAGTEQEPECPNRLALVGHTHAASVDYPLWANVPVELGMGVPAHDEVLFHPGKDFLEPVF
jgi:hypothetical protein